MYLLDIERPVCAKCRRPARVRLFNRYNAVVGDYCKTCGKRELKAAEARVAATRGTRPTSVTVDDPLLKDLKSPDGLDWDDRRGG